MNFCLCELILKLLVRIGEWHQNLNEMVSLGDTAISLHKLQPPTAKGGGGRGCVLESQNPKCQDLAKFQFSGEGVFWKVKTQSAKISIFRGGAVFWNQIPEQGCSEQFGQKILEA